MVAPGSIFPLLVAILALNPPSVSFAKKESSDLEYSVYRACPVSLSLF